MMDPRRKAWNERQQRLNQALEKAGEHAAALGLFLEQHALVYAAEVTGAEVGTFEDEVWEGLSDAAAQAVRARFAHSIAWMLWHTARCEDITLNLLVAGEEEVLLRGGWMEKLGVAVRDTGNAMDAAALEQFNHAIDLDALREYRSAVALRTREIVQRIAPGGFKQKVLAQRAAQIIPSGAVVEEARGLVDYWANRTIGGLLLMPATRHHLVHLNEAMRVKGKV